MNNVLVGRARNLTVVIVGLRAFDVLADVKFCAQIGLTFICELLQGGNNGNI